MTQLYKPRAGGSMTYLLSLPRTEGFLGMQEFPVLKLRQSQATLVVTFAGGAYNNAVLTKYLCASCIFQPPL